MRGGDEFVRTAPPPRAPRDPDALTAAAAAFASPSTWCLDGTMTLGSGNQGCRPPHDPAREAADEAATREIADNMEKYCNIVRRVTLFSEMGEAEIEAAAAALQVKTFKKGEIVYDEVRCGAVGRVCGMWRVVFESLCVVGGRCWWVWAW